MLVMIQRICAALDKVSLGRVAVLKRSVTTVAIPPALVRRHSHGMPIRKRFSRDTRTTWAHNLVAGSRWETPSHRLLAISQADPHITSRSLRWIQRCREPTQHGSQENSLLEGCSAWSPLTSQPLALYKRWLLHHSSE